VSNLHPTMQVAIAPYTNLFAYLAAHPLAAERQEQDEENYTPHDATWREQVEFLGQLWWVDVNKHTRRAVEIVNDDGTDWTDAFSLKAQQKLADMVTDKIEPGICPACAGSGEGMHEGTRCSSCRGKGHA